MLDGHGRFRVLAGWQPRRPYAAAFLAFLVRTDRVWTSIRAGRYSPPEIAQKYQTCSDRKQLDRSVIH